MTRLIGKDSHRMDVKGWDTIFQANRGQKQGVTIPDLLDQTQQISSQNWFKPVHFNKKCRPPIRHNDCEYLCPNVSTLSKHWSQRYR